jgi:TAZ zinc finger/Zinc finger, ZZ type/Histone acetylation protein
MVEYLRYVKKRGFHSAYIWSCPPVGGDDYIFYCHPKHQLVPREDMLRLWYHKMLDQAKAQGIVIRTSTLYDDFFVKDGCDADPNDVKDPTFLPYFEGDYIPGEIEIVIQQLEESGEAAITNSSHDSVMVRLGHHLSKMKDNFIVVQLRSSRFIDAVQHGQDVSSWKEDSDDEVIRSKRAKISSKSTSESCSPKMQSSSSVATPFELEKMDSSGVQVPTASSTLLEEHTGQNIRDAKVIKDAIDESSLSSSQPIQESDIIAGESISKIVSEELKNDPPLEDNKANVESEAAIYESSSSSSQPIQESDSIAGESISKIVSEELKNDPPLEDNKANVESEAAIYESSSSSSQPIQESDSIAGESISKIVSEELKNDPPREDDKANVESEAEGHPISQTSASLSKEESCVFAGDNETGHVTNNPFPEGGTHRVAEGTAITEGDGLGQSLEVADNTQSVSIDKEENDGQSNELSLRESSDVPSNKRVLDEIKPAIEINLSGRNGIAVADTTDEDPPMDNEMFESRQQFLNYCQATHCQFDELRRAKHSTVMVLFQLHNPSAPKFLQQCGACYRDITHGIRYHCNDCSNFDLCDDCYEPVVTGLWPKRDPRFAHDSSHSFSPIDMETTEESQKSISDRLKSLKAHVELLEHAGACEGSTTCSLHNCDRLKKLFLHVPSCDIKPKKECKICTRLLVLCTMHARLCTSRGSCPIPFCDRIRERNKRLRRQQQLMDDRRRQAQNELYHAGGEI